MKSWNSAIENVTLKDGTVAREYDIRFRTTDRKIYKRIERFFQDIMDEADTPQTDRMTEEEIDTMLAKVLVAQTDCEDTSCPYFKNPDYSRCMRCKSQTKSTGSPIGDYRDGAGAWAPMPLGDPGSISDGALLTALETWLNRNPDKQIKVDERITRHEPVFTASIEPVPWTIQKEE